MVSARTARGLLLLVSLIGLTLSAPSAAASPESNKFSALSIPTEGKPGQWVLAEGSDIRHLTAAADGTLYCYASPSGTSYTLFKSSDGGYSWSHGKVTDTIVAIATAPDNASIIYYATASAVLRSTNAGGSFIPLPPNPGGAGSGQIEITCLDVTRWGNAYMVAAGTRDSDAGEYGGILTLNENEGIPTWLDANLHGDDVYALAFSPGLSTQQIVAVVTDEVDTLVTTRIGGGGWGDTIGDARLNKDNSETPVSVSVDSTAAVSFPDDYTVDNGTLFVAIDAGAENGDVYRIDSIAAPGNSTATDLNIGTAYGLSNIDMTSLIADGNGAACRLAAGAAHDAQVYFSRDGGNSWTKSAKPPTGQSKTYIVSAQSSIYAATSGMESAVSQSTDGCATWNQTGLIDTQIETSGLRDLTISPGYGLFLLTYGGGYSLWRSLTGGAKWERVLTSALAGADSFDKVKLSPGSGQVVFLAGSYHGDSAIWKSIDSSQSFGLPQVTHDPVSGVPFTISAWAVADDNTLLIGSYDGSNGLVYRSANSGLAYSRKIVGTHALNSISLSPDYTHDGMVLVGNTWGEVFWCQDNEDFWPLGNQLPNLLTGDNSVTPAFDPLYKENMTVYAASHCQKGTNNSSAVYRLVVSRSAKWEAIRTMAPGAVVDQVALSANGVLYAANSATGGGVERCLNPRFPLGLSFETVTRGLASNTTLNGLWLVGGQLWTIDSKNNQVLTYVDTLAWPAALTSPPDKASGIEPENISLDWEVLEGATEYEWQLSYETDFSSIPADFEGSTAATSARLPVLEPATTYYWQVRATKPVSSPWSAKWSFTTRLGEKAIGPELYYPQPGASEMLLRPIFQWTAVPGADRYEILVSPNTSFAAPVVNKTGAHALPATAWQCDTNLEYGTTYYWKVRGCNANTYGAWSPVSAFATRPVPEPPAPTSVPTPAPTTAPPPSAPTTATAEKPSLPSPTTEELAPPSTTSASPASPAPIIINLPPQTQSAPPAGPLFPPDLVKWLIALGATLFLTMLATIVTLIMLLVKIRRM